MNKKGLIGKLKRGIYAPLIAGALGVGSLIGCDKNPVYPSNPPQNTLSVSPTSGMSPLQVRIQGRCTDPDGDLRNYQITSGGSIITRTNPIDTLVTLTENTSYTSACEDMKGNVSNVGPVNVSVSQPPENNPPRTSLNVDPDSGVAPLESRIQYLCTDLDGVEDIEKSYLIVGNDTLRTNSLDSIFTFNQPTAVKGYCEDKQGANSSAGPINVQVSQPDFLDISGKLQDLRTDVGSPGEIAVYAFPDTTLLGKFPTDVNGNFSFNLDSILPRDSVYVQARLNAGAETPDSNFVRTIVLPNKDTTNLIVRAYPYDTVLSNNGISRNGIRAHLQELNPRYFKWNLDSLNGGLKGVEIIDVDPLGRGEFTPEEQNAIEQTFRENLSCYTGGRLNDNPDSLYIQKDNPSTSNLYKHYTTNENGDLILEKNWIFITRDTIMPYGGLTGSGDNDGTLNSASISINQVLPLVTSHEQGHSFIAPYGAHASTLPSPQTIMRANGPYLSVSPGPADCEAGYIVNEETFKPRESYERTLGLGFFRQYNQ